MAESDQIAPTTRSLKRKDLCEDDQSELDQLDHIFKRIKAAVPPVPYILSTPSMHPYRYHSQQEANAWMMGRLFRHDEEHLQYRTFLYREPCQDCFELQAGEEDEPEPVRPKVQAASTPNQGPKKKISLSAYKSGKASGTITPIQDSKKSSPNLPPKPPMPPSASQLQSNGTSKSHKQSAANETAHSKPQKRPIPEARDERRPDKESQESHRLEPASRPRASSASNTDSAESKNVVDKSSPSNSTPHGLPPLLSPVHEPLSNPYGLPSILSPTLPSVIQQELDRLKEKEHPARPGSSASVSSTEPKSSQPAPIANPLEHIAERAAKKQPRIRAVSVNGKTSSAVPAPAASTATAPSSVMPTSTGPTNNTAPTTTTEETDSFVVKLKYPKAKADTIESLLKAPPKRAAPEKKEKERPAVPKESPRKEKVSPRKEKISPVKSRALDGIAVKASNSTLKIVQRRVDTSTPSSTVKPSRGSEKRPRTDDDASLMVPSKRPRAPSNDRQVTPTPQTASSNKPSSTQKAQVHYATPKKELKSVNMLRTASTESHDTTPGRSGATPAGRVDAKVTTSAPIPAKKSADIQLMAQTSMKLNQMGRSLKHEATKILTSSKATKQDEKRAAVINLECILSYMAAYHAQDLSLILRGRPCEVEQTWKTLLPLCLSYSRSTKPFVHLDGLREYLSSIIASTICTCVSARCTQLSSGKPADSPHDLPPADLAKLAENFALLSDHTRKNAQHFADARIALSFETIQKSYPRTYAGRDAKESDSSKDRSASRLAGPYALPLGNDTNAIQGVRFGLRFLEEYCDKEGVQYRVRLNLDRVE